MRLAVQEGRAVLSVEDTGVGIPAQALSGLFVAFHQVEADVARSKSGLGLGLAVVKGLVELHGGAVRADSAGPGQGAQFTLWLPLDRQAAAAAPDEPAPAPPPAADLRRVLIIEDHRDAAESLRMLLALQGHETHVAHGGPEGVETARAMRPDVVVCDLGLPGMSGFEVARTLRADPATACALLICVSGYGQAEDRKKALQAGFDAALVKPADPDELQRLMAGPQQASGAGEE